MEALADGVSQEVAAWIPDGQDHGLIPGDAGGVARIHLGRGAVPRLTLVEGLARTSCCGARSAVLAAGPRTASMARIHRGLELGGWWPDKVMSMGRASATFSVEDAIPGGLLIDGERAWTAWHGESGIAAWELLDSLPSPTHRLLAHRQVVVEGRSVRQVFVALDDGRFSYASDPPPAWRAFPRLISPTVRASSLK